MDTDSGSIPAINERGGWNCHRELKKMLERGQEYHGSRINKDLGNSHETILGRNLGTFSLAHWRKSCLSSFKIFAILFYNSLFEMIPHVQQTISIDIPSLE